MRIAFHCNQIGLRGTEVATFDYAVQNQEILGNESLVVFPLLNRRNNLGVFWRFRSRIPTKSYVNLSHLERILRRFGVQAFYALKGSNDGPVPRGPVTLVHGVFDSVTAHGDRFAYISAWLARRMGHPDLWVPHMVSLPQIDGDLREQLGIPQDAVVFGRHGGYRTFDIEFAQHAVYQLLRERQDLWFLLLNTKRFGPRHPRLIHLGPTADIGHKIRFVQTCNAMLHARQDGETFGLAVAEFSVCDRPVLTWTGSKDLAHLEYLGEKAYRYHDESSLLEILRNFHLKRVEPGYWDCYSHVVSPQQVMRQFREVFLSGF